MNTIERTAGAEVIPFPEKILRVLLCGFDSFARRAIEDPSLSMIPPRGDDLFFESFDVGAIDARRDPAAALAMLESFLSGCSLPVLVLVGRGDDATAEAAAAQGASVLRAPFTAEDVRHSLFALPKS